MNSNSDSLILRRLMRLVVPYAPMLFLAVFGYLLFSVAVMLLADILQFILDALEGQAEKGRGLISSAVAAIFGSEMLQRESFTRIAVPLSMILIVVLRGLGYIAGVFGMSYVSRGVVHDLRTDLFRRLLSAPRQSVEQTGLGHTLANFGFKVNQMVALIQHVLDIALREGLTVTMLFAYMIYLNWRLAMIFLALAPVLAFLVSYSSRFIRRYAQRIQSSTGTINHLISETVKNLLDIRLFSGTQYEYGRFSEASEYNRVQSVKIQLAGAILQPTVQLMLALALAFLVWVLFGEALRGTSTGEMVAFLTAAGLIAKPIRQLTSLVRLWQQGVVAAHDVFALQDAPPEWDRGEYQVQRVQGDLRVENLSFRYRPEDPLALKNVSFSIAPGQMVALVGRNGSGKSTLFHLLTRMYLYEQGKISLDGVDIRDYRLASLRAQFAVVSQQIALFEDTIYHNIAYGSLATADREQVWRALEEAAAREFVERLPTGLETRIGRKGVQLSGGQRQRIAIARALLKDAPLLLLDEPTAALDPHTEAQVREALQRLEAHRSCIVIAHRLETVQHADLILVFRDGQLVERGRHEELLAAEGEYAQLYQRRFSE